jgi:hypothetical protein
MEDSKLEVIYNQMKSWEKSTLQLIVQKFASLQFGLPALKNAIDPSEISGAEVTAGLVYLRRKEIIMAIRKHWGEDSYCLPENMLSKWQRILMKSDKSWEEQKASGNAVAFNTTHPLCLNLFVFLNYLQHHEFALTKKGEIPKRHIHKIAEKMKWKEAIVPKWNSKYEENNVYSAALALSIDFAVRLHLIQWETQGLKLRSSNLKEWLQLSIDEMNDRLYCAFLEIVEPCSVADKHFLTKIGALSFQKWYLIEDFIYWLQEYDIIILFSEWLDVLEAFGWIEQSFDFNNQAVFRRMVLQELSQETSSSNDKFYVQPDYEILVPPDVSFSVRWELTFFSDHLHTDHVGVYRLTEQSLHRALFSGRTVESCLQFLFNHSFYGIPDHIHAAFEIWAGSFIPNTILSRKIAVMEQEESKSIASEIMDTTILYTIQSGIPSRNEIYPLWQTIPSHWWKDCRAYHASTQKEMVQIAIEWQALLKLCMDSQEWIVIPKQIQEEEKGWNLIGWVKSNLITYSQDQWQTMQLILPGFDES